MSKKMKLKSTLSLVTLMFFIATFYTNCSSDYSSTDTNTSVNTECRALSGVSASPQTIAQAVALINSLPKPTTVACFVESLSRPLEIYATSSVSSAQPAAGERSPRIFLFTPNLVISIVPDGRGAEVVEFGEFKGSTRTLKGEIAFPVTNQLSRSAPFEGLAFRLGTICATCHGFEVRDTSITYAEAFISDVVKPFAFFRVAPSRLEEERLACNDATEPNRCEILNALLMRGPLTERDFGSAAL